MKQRYGLNYKLKRILTLALAVRILPAVTFLHDAAQIYVEHKKHSQLRIVKAQTSVIHQQRLMILDTLLLMQKAISAHMSIYTNTNIMQILIFSNFVFLT